jgi:hypothetical protein
MFKFRKNDILGVKGEVSLSDGEKKELALAPLVRR